jgi:hypothetical protein
MGRIGLYLKGFAGALALACASPALAQMPHTLPSPLLSGMPDPVTQANGATQLERDRPVGWALGEHRKLDVLLKAIQPQRKGVVDAYVVTIALDSDPVFSREAREAGKVLGRRYDAAAGRTIVLAGPSGAGAADDLPRGSPDHISAVLARIAELMDPQEDVLVLYTTSHGAPFGIVYSDGDSGYGQISPSWLWSTLGELQIRNRLLIISACFSGIFAPMLAGENTVVITAAAADRTSFGCVSENDWTFFGDAMINHALRKPQPITTAFNEARTTVAGWESQGRMIPSRPQIEIATTPPAWLAALERKLPATATEPVGRPAVTALADATRNNH